MILVGIAFLALLALAFAGRALGDPSEDEASGGVLGALLFILLLIGIVLQKKRAREEDEF